MFKLLNNKKGLTLVEIIVSIGVLGIVMIPIFSMFLTTVKVNNDSKDKLKATSIAQEYMEKIKGASSLDQIKSGSVDGYEVEISKTPVDKYKFPITSTEEDSGENSNIEYDLIVEVDKDNSGEIAIINAHNKIKICNESFEDSGKIYIKNKQGEFNITLDSDRVIQKDSNKKDGKIRVELYEDLDITMNAENEFSDSNLDFHFAKSSNYTGSYTLNNKGGLIKQYFNVPIEEENTYSHPSRVYKIEITVKKNDKTLEILEGYKTFLE